MSLIQSVRRLSIRETADALLIPKAPRERRPSQQDMADSAMLFLERRRSSDHGIGSIQPDLYRRRGSVVTHKKQPGRTSMAKVQIQLSYDFSKSDFLVSLLQVNDVVTLDECSVVLRISDSLYKRESTKIVAGAQFHKEQFKFAMSYDELMNRSLIIELLGSKRIGCASYVVGSTSMPLSQIDPTDDVILWTHIEQQNNEEPLGEIFVGVQYLSSAERLTVTLHQARSLSSKDGLPNSFVKVYLIIDGKIVKKRKSGVRKNSSSPVWNEAVNFTVPTQQLHSVKLELHVIDHDRIGHDKVIGQACIGGESRDRLWREVISLKTVHPTWIPLTFL